MTVINNYIGINKVGAPLPNTASGIVASGDGLAQIGGTSPNGANFIKHNGKAGVFVYRFVGPFGTTPGKNVIVRGNSIADNGGLGIDLANLPNPTNDPDGVTVNDCFDEDDGANNLQNYPELLAPVFNGNGTVKVEGTLRSTPATDFIIDFYSNAAADPSDYGEGETHLGSLTVLTDGNGFAAFTFTSTVPVSASHKITATAMDFFGNTSEFSCYAGQCTTGTLPQAIERAAAGCVQPIIVTVNTDEDDPNTADGVCDVDTNTPGSQCSLRAAIQEANARNGLDVINFAIPGSGVQTILPAIQLPTITERVIINGTTQPSYNGSPVIEVRGDGGTALTGLLIQTNKTTIQGLVINRFLDVGIEINGNENAIEECFIGVNPDGVSGDTTRRQNAGVVIRNTNSQNNRIGGAVFATGNVIGNNIAGIFLSGANVKSNLVINNMIGTDKNGTAALPNDIFRHKQGW